MTQKTAPFSGVVPLVTMMRYESFGRLAELDQPSDQVPGTADLQHPALLVQYNDSGPARMVFSQTIDGTDASPIYRSHYKYMEGFGDTLFAVDQADPTTASPLASVKSY